MKIGILSDPHKKKHLQKKAIKLLKKQGAKMLIHAGDFKIIENLQSLDESGLKYEAVLGNNDKHLEHFADTYNLHKEPYNFQIKGLNITLMHKPLFFEENSDIYIFGHTHTFKCSYVNNELIINPGEICGRDHYKCECVLLDIKQHRYKVTYNYSDADEINWESEEFVYER